MSKLKELLKKSVKNAKDGRKPKTVVPVDLPEGVKLDRKTGEFVLPSSPGACADILYATREARLALDRRSEELARLESKLKDFFVDTLPLSDATGVAGRVARVQIQVRPVPQVEDWEKFYGYVGRHGAWELLQRRIREEAVAERLDAGEGAAMGVGVFRAKKVSVTRL